MNNRLVIDCIYFYFGTSVLENSPVAKWFEAAQEDVEPPPLPQTSAYYQKQFLQLFSLLYPSYIQTHYFMKKQPANITLLKKYKKHIERQTEAELRLKGRIRTSKSK